MSLYSDLNEVLTPYAQRIKGLAAADEELKADLGAYTWHRKGFINLTTDPVVLTPTANNGIDCLVADCAAGDVFTVTASGGASSRAWGFLDSGNHVLTVADAITQIEEREITAPTNAVKIVVNNMFANGNGKVYRVGNNIESRLSTIEKGGSGLTNEVKEALLACFDYVAWSGNDGKSYFDDLKDAFEGNLHMVFSSGISIGSSPNPAPSGSAHYGEKIASRNYTAARAAAKHPIRNKGYVYTVTDPTKYNICIADIASMEKIPIVSSPNRPDDFGYLVGTTSSREWATSASSTDPYVWIFLKKLDGTEFTAAELENEAATVFTHAEPSS